MRINSILKKHCIGYRRLCFNFFTSLIVVCAASVNAEERLHVWMKAFIPSIHPVLPDYFVKTERATWAVRAPKIPLPLTDIGELSGTCFLTDNREFDSDHEASARVSVEFVIVIEGRDVHLEKFPGRDLVTIGQTENVDCITGKQLRPAKQASIESVSISDWKTSPSDNFLKVMNVRAASPNPFYKLFSAQAAPDIDFEVVVQYSLFTRKVKIIGTVGYFPSFEMYYKLNNSATKELIKLGPYKDSTALSLFDLGLGINRQGFEVSVSVDKK